MGCCCGGSTQVIQKQTNILPLKHYVVQQKPQADSYLIGQINQKQHIFYGIYLNTNKIQKLSIPDGFNPKNLSSMIQTNKGTYLITGGISSDLTDITSQCYLYSAKDHSIVAKANMINSRYTHCSIYANGFVYVIGGRYFGEDQEAILPYCQKYSPQENKWKELPDLNVKRCTGFCLQFQQKIYAIGGYTGKYQRSTVIECLNKEQKKWEKIDFELTIGIESGTMLTTNKNQVTIFGGNTDDGPTDNVFSINLQSKLITKRKPLKEKRTLHKSFSYGSELIIFGGTQNNYNKIQIYNIEKGQSKLVDIKLSDYCSQQCLQALTQSSKSVIVS